MHAHTLNYNNLCTVLFTKGVKSSAFELNTKSHLEQHICVHHSLAQPLHRRKEFVGLHDGQQLPNQKSKLQPFRVTGTIGNGVWAENGGQRTTENAGVRLRE